MTRCLGLWLALAVSTGLACRHRTVALPLQPMPLRCLETESAPLKWFRPGDVSRLDRWCAQVGSPVVVTAGSDGAAGVARLLVVGWNVNVGGGRVLDFVEWLRSRAVAESGEVGFVLLLQETFRAGGNIPPPAAGGGIPKGIRPVRPTLDVAALGRYLGMSVAYVPSMRNGDADDPEKWEDRGSAVLSTEPMSDIRAIELPLGRQRRVAVMATITPRGSLSPMRVIAAHLDTMFGNRRGQATELARRIEEFKAEIDRPPLLLSADTNAFRGSHDEAVKELGRAIPLMEQCGTGSTTRFFLRLDFVFSTFEPSQVHTCRTYSDEYGSDHRPLVVTFEHLRPVD